MESTCRHKLCILSKSYGDSGPSIFPMHFKIWEKLTKGILLEKYSERWREIIKTTTDNNLDKTKSFILRYVFQNTIHSVWKERNEKRHGGTPSPPEIHVKLIDKNIRNRLNTIRSSGDLRYEGGIRQWFASRRHQR